MRRTMFAVPALFAICLACSSGSRRSANPPPPPVQDHSLTDVFLRLGKGKCTLRETNNSHWVIDFSKSRFGLDLEVEYVGIDFVRLTDGNVRSDLPFSSIVLVTSDH